MVKPGIIHELFRRRWPDGFSCPRCGHREYYVISSRSLPLYQCKLCSRQTTVTSGTIMDKTRTSLDKWHAAIERLSTVNGMNASRLACAINVTHKVAWTMLRKFRKAIDDIESSRKLEGNVYAGTWALAPKFIWIFLPDRYYRKERVVSLFGASDNKGNPAIKIIPASAIDLEYGMKQLTVEAKRKFQSKAADPVNSHTSWMNKTQMARSALMKRFEEARDWLNVQFNGIGSRYLGQYLAEFCFRWNVAARNGSLREEWYRLCFPV